MLGVIAATSLIAAAFFLKFWRQTRDSLFLAFSAAFFIEGLNRIGVLFLDSPNEGRPAVYVVRCLAFVLIIIAIIGKNRGNLGARDSGKP